jgi:hypothetical protein
MMIHYITVNRHTWFSSRLFCLAHSKDLLQRVGFFFFPSNEIRTLRVKGHLFFQDTLNSVINKREGQWAYS